MSDILISVAEAWASLCQVVGHTEIGYWLAEHVYAVYTDDLDKSAAFWGSQIIMLPIISLGSLWVGYRSR